MHLSRILMHICKARGGLLMHLSRALTHIYKAREVFSCTCHVFRHIFAGLGGGILMHLSLILNIFARLGAVFSCTCHVFDLCKARGVFSCMCHASTMSRLWVRGPAWSLVVAVVQSRGRVKLKEVATRVWTARPR